MTLRALALTIGAAVCATAVAAGPAREVADPAHEPVGPLPFYYDLHTFRGEDGLTEVVASVAVPARGLHPERVDGAVRYRFDIRFVLSDTVLGTVVRTDDSVFVSRPWSLDRDHLLHTHVRLQARPSKTAIQRVVMTDATTPGVGQLYGSSFAVPDYGGGDLMLSDIALGLPGATAGWTRRGVTLALLPTSQFPESAFDLYYEIYNPTPGAAYETEIAIEPVSGESERERVRLRFDGTATSAPDAVLGELRRIETALPEGAYRLRVTVTEPATGRSASSERPFAVRPWASGATLVAAIPRRR